MLIHRSASTHVAMRSNVSRETNHGLYIGRWILIHRFSSSHVAMRSNVSKETNCGRYRQVGLNTQVFFNKCGNKNEGFKGNESWSL